MPEAGFFQKDLNNTILSLSHMALSPLDPDTYKMVMGYYQQVQDKITKILSNEEPNQLVSSPDFLEPSVFYSKEGIPLSEMGGEFAYYWRIRCGLEAALVKGYIPAKLMPDRAPDEIRALREPGTEDYRID